ncbi:MAG: hypothetical protein FD149_1654 [Rhodospirillaceae bacterium]|nr:MAG: hypothetical protein FD149_1654 [Rhodospirillaceae bacterium]
MKSTDSNKKRSGTGLISRLRAYFFAGVLVTAPAAVTFYVAWAIIDFIDRQVTPWLPPRYNPETYLPFGVPGLGLLILVLGLTAIGALTAGFLGHVLVRTGERLLARMPVIRSIYSTVKQITETVLRQQSNAFREVVLLEYPRRGIWVLGFITAPAASEICERTAGDVVNVFIPTTPNPTSGFLLFAPQSELIWLSMTVEEGIKMVISGGIVSPSKPSGP